MVPLDPARLVGLKLNGPQASVGRVKSALGLAYSVMIWE